MTRIPAQPSTGMASLAEAPEEFARASPPEGNDSNQIRPIRKMVQFSQSQLESLTEGRGRRLPEDWSRRLRLLPHIVRE
jgi:hypothetical protein